jgi:hypothetical protein
MTKFYEPNEPKLTGFSITSIQTTATLEDGSTTVVPPTATTADVVLKDASGVPTFFTQSEIAMKFHEVSA